MLRILVIMAVSLLAGTVAAKECIPTPHRTTGTHYKPVTEQGGDIGKGFKFRGRVLLSPDCRPVANARIAHWQAGKDGRYRDELRAYLFSDEQGYFQFETEWPNLFPPHIHFIVSKQGYDTLETQWIGADKSTETFFEIVVEEK